MRKAPHRDAFLHFDNVPTGLILPDYTTCAPRCFDKLSMTEGVLSMTEGVLSMTKGVLSMTEGVLSLTELGTA